MAKKPTYEELEQRIKKLIAITVEALDKNKLTEELQKIYK